MDQAITDSLNCHRICVETIAYCLKMGGKHVESDHMQILTDCAEICKLNASFMIRNSTFNGRVAELCADICEKCAASCEVVNPADTQLKTCAEMCRKCASSCRQIEERTEVV